MHAITTDDGARLHVEDGGAGAPVVFTHGWTLGGEMWEYCTTPLVEWKLRCLAIDRRGCGRSTTGSGDFGYDRLADDLAGVLARLVLVAPGTPRIRHADDNPHGIPAATLDEMLAALLSDKPAYLAAGAEAFFGSEEATSAEFARWAVGLAARASLRASAELLRTFARTDVRDDLPRVGVPTLVVHGDADASAPLDLCGRPTAQLVPDARLVVYTGGPQGLPLARGHQERLTADILAWARAGAPAGAAAA